MQKIEYKTSVDDIKIEQLNGFFVGWGNPPTKETHLKILQNSDHVVIALKDEKVVGYITGITDKIMSAYIPFLEVLPEHQDQGIGKELTRRMLSILQQYYMIDLLCDTDLQNFYEQFGMKKTQGMSIRNYPKQSGTLYV